MNIKTVLSYAFKDLKRQRVRSILGVMGVSISIALLTIVLFLSDSISVSFIDYLTTDAGDQDLTVGVWHYDGEPENRTSYFPFVEMSEQIKQNVSTIECCIPRFELNCWANATYNFSTTESTNYRRWLRMVGINFTLENQAKFGTFMNDSTPIQYDGLELYHFMATETLTNNLQLSPGDSILMTVQTHNGTDNVEKNVTLIFNGPFDYQLKFPSQYTYSSIVVSLETVYEICSEYDYIKEGYCSLLICTFVEGGVIYDVRTVEQTSINLKSIGEQVQYTVGFGYKIGLPKLVYLGYAEFFSVALSIIFVFISIIAMLIAGILINGILSTSVEERIREFGVFRTLGGHKTFNLVIVLTQGLLLCLIGTTMGVATAIGGTQAIIFAVNNIYYDVIYSLLTNGIQFSYSLWSIIFAYVIGISVSLIVSLSPAIKVMRLQIVESINPYRREDVLYHLRKKSSVNYKLIIVGIILAANGGFIYLVIPQLFMSMNLSLLASTLIAILLIFLIGLTLAGLGLMPVILNIVINIFRPFSRKIHHIVKIFVNRFQRRNSNTVVMFSFSFSFVIFVSTIVQTLQFQIADLVRYNLGSNLVVRSTAFDTGSGGGLFGGMGGGGGGFALFSDTSFSQTVPKLAQDEDDTTVDPLSTLTVEFEKKLMTIEGIERTSSVIANPSQLSEIYAEQGKKFEATLSDYVGFSGHDITLYGIDENYKSTIYINDVQWTHGNDNSFDRLFETDQNNCIISEAIAESLNLRFGEEIRITFTRGTEIEYVPFFIVGISNAMPGFADFKASIMYAEGGGVMISQENYIEYMDIPEPAWVDKIYVKLAEDKLDQIFLIESEIEDQFSEDYELTVSNIESFVEAEEEAFYYINILFQAILMAVIVICLFGLLSSAYSTILERKKEIAIIRTLGLKGYGVNRLFIIEALIIMISSGMVGVLVGWLTAWLLSSNMNTFTEMPFQGRFPWDSLLLIYGISTLVTLVGMHFILKKVRTGNIIEIYRETGV